MAYGKSISVNYLAKKLSNKYVNIPSRKGEPFETLANINKIKKHLKWYPKISFDEGLNIILKNVNDWNSAPLWNKKNIKSATKSWFKYMS